MINFWWRFGPGYGFRITFPFLSPLWNMDASFRCKRFLPFANVRTSWTKSLEFTATECWKHWIQTHFQQAPNDFPFYSVFCASILMILGLVMFSRVYLCVFYSNCRSILFRLIICVGYIVRHHWASLNNNIIIISKTMFMVLSSEPLREFTRFIWWMQNSVKWPPTQDQARRRRLWVRPYRLPESTPTIAIYCYYSARKLILILPSHRG